ncbi:MAG: Crp/Fnr family transcriptional regulator [Anaerolineales bacterium]|nr:Crp/Fnr family transcriptional regulator [Anaerolineales bacterium]
MPLDELLAQHPVFAGLSPSDLQLLASLARTRDYAREAWITYYGDIWPYLFLVESGEVIALKESSEGRSLIMITLQPGEIFWGLAFFLEEAPMPVSLTAAQPSRIHAWSRPDLLPILMRNGACSWELARLMVGRMLRASQIVEELAFQPVAVRLANLLLERFGDAVGDYITRDLTLDEMAAYIGTTREMVCRSLYRFAEEGAIQIKRTEFMIADREKLEAQAGKPRR